MQQLLQSYLLSRTCCLLLALVLCQSIKPGLTSEPIPNIDSTNRADIQRPLNFENDIVPILTKFGCNASGCHGKAEGQNGFKLSVFGFDPMADHTASCFRIEAVAAAQSAAQ